MAPPLARFGRVTVYFGEKNGKYPDGNQVVVNGTDTKAIFDTPLSANGWGPLLAGADLVLLGHVHEDHTCAVHLLPGAQVFAHEADVEAMRSMEGMLAHYGYSPRTSELMSRHIVERFHYQPRPDARAYSHGRVWELGGSRVTAFHLPGHTGGHSALLVEPEGVAFIGDIELSGFGPYYGDGCSDLAAFRSSLEEVERLEARVWVTSHHKGVITERDTFLGLLKAYKENIRMREEALLAWLAQGSRTMEELVSHRFLFPAGFQDVFVEDAERITIQAHLTELTGQGRVREREGRYMTAAGN